MLDHLSLFISGPEQLFALAGSLGLCLVLTWVGALIGGKDRIKEVDLLVGWSLYALLATAWGTITGGPFTPVLILLLVLAGIGLYLRLKRGEGVLPEAWLKVVIVATPILVLTAAMSASQWDEFSHWVQMVKLLVEIDRFPVGDNMFAGGMFPGYPFGWLYLPYAASEPFGQVLESAGGTLNILLWLTFGLIVTREIRKGLGLDPDSSLPWGWAAATALIALLLNPTFVTKVVMTSYADASSAVVMGAVGYVLWKAYEDEGTRRSALFLQAALMLSVLINLKQSNLVLVVLVVVATVMALMLERKHRSLKTLAPFALITVPAILVYAMWRYHVGAHLPVGAEAFLNPFETWPLGDIPVILQNMFNVLVQKSGYFFTMVFALAFGLTLLWTSSTPLKRLAAICGLSFLGFNAFLLLIYVAHFGDGGVKVFSLWRYNMHLGGLSLLLAALVLTKAWVRWGQGRIGLRVLPAICLFLVVVAPIAMAERLRFDLEAPKPFYRMLGNELAQDFPDNARLAILDPLGTGESRVITNYELWDHKEALVDYMGSFRDPRPERINQSLDLATHILVYSTLPSINEAIGLALPDYASFLLSRTSEGDWQIERTWDWDEDMRTWKP